MLKEIQTKAEIYRKSANRNDGAPLHSHDHTVNCIIDSSNLVKLTCSELQTLSYTLMHMNANKGLNVIIENDQKEFWAFIYDMIISEKRINAWIREHNPLFSFLYVSAVRKMKPQYDDNQNRLWQNKMLRIDLFNDMFSSVWSGFSYLEGLCRRICDEYIDLDGTVKKGFKVAGENQKAVKYKKNKKINNLGDCLLLTMKVVSNPTYHTLNMFFNDYTPQDIYRWQNDSLQGAEDKSITTIVVYCLISILLIEVFVKSVSVNFSSSPSGNGTNEAASEKFYLVQ